MSTLTTDRIDAARKAGYLTGFKDLAEQLADKICDVSDILMDTNRIDAVCTAFTTVLEMIAVLAEDTALQFMPPGKEGEQ